MSISRLVLALLVVGMAAQLWSGLGRAFAPDEAVAPVVAQAELLPSVSAPPPAIRIVEARGVIVSDYEARRISLSNRAR